MWFSFFFLIIKCLYFNDIVTLPFASSFVEVFDLFCTQLYLVTIIRSHVKNEMWFSLKLKLFDFWKKIKKIKWHSTDREKLIAIHSEEELKSFLIKVKEESEKVGLKLNIQKTKIMASGPITSWQIDGETVETVSDFIFWGSKITVDGDCSHEIKRRLLLGRKVMTNLDSIFKSRNITLPTEVRLVKAMVFPVVMYGCESWTTKKAEPKELMLLNCGVGEDSWESLGLRGDPTSPS